MENVFGVAWRRIISNADVHNASVCRLQHRNKPVLILLVLHDQFEALIRAWVRF